MPGRSERMACTCSMSAARSMTACWAASFCRTHIRPPMCASVGRALLAADIFLHQLDVRGRHENSRAAVEFDFQMLFDGAVLLQQLHARDSGRCRAKDARRNLLRAVRGSCRSPGPTAGASAGSDLADETARRWKPARSARSPGEILLAVGRSENAACRWPRAGSLPKISRSRSTSASVGQTMKHVVTQADGIELVAHFGDVAAESLDAFDSQLAFRLPSSRWPPPPR